MQSTRERGKFQRQEKAMKPATISLLLLGTFTALSTVEASAVVCAAGVHHAGCVARHVRHRVVAPVAPSAVVVAPTPNSNGKKPGGSRNSD
jgi:hypothetical protein